MAKTYTPIMVQDPFLAQCTVAAANTARDGSGVLVDLFTAGADGARISRVEWVSAQAAVAANSAMVGRVFITDTAGLNPKLKSEVAITAVTASNIAIGAAFTIKFDEPMPLRAGQKIQVAQSIYAGVQDQMHVNAFVGNF
jgi:hypothetical protein